VLSDKFFIKALSATGLSAACSASLGHEVHGVRGVWLVCACRVVWFFFTSPREAGSTGVVGALGLLVFRWLAAAIMGCKKHTLPI
jgi:hypothetical protein